MERIVKIVYSLALLVCLQVSAADRIPVPSRTILSSEPSSLNRSAQPASPVTTSLPQSPSPATHFGAVVGPGNGVTVPDTHGTVGTNAVITMLNETKLNTEILIQSRAGSAIKTNIHDSFWGSSNINSSAEDAFDPRLLYDPYHHRWIAVAVIARGATNSGILIGVSMTSNPTNSWNLRRVKADANSLYWADHPTVGFNKDWIVVQANMGTITNTVFDRSHIWVFNKTSLYAGNFPSPTLLTHTNAGAIGNEVPAITYDTSLSTMYLLQNANGNTNANGWLRLFSITGSIGSETLNYVTNPVYITTTKTWADVPSTNTELWRCCFAPQKDTNHLIGTMVDARMHNVVYRNGSLWSAQTVFLPANNPTRSAIQWWQINPSPLQLLQIGRIDDSTGTNFYSYGSLAVNKFNDVLIGYSSFAATQYASANYSFRAYYDTRNEMRSTYRYKAGNAVYVGESRWGDYSASTVDPVDDTALWTIQEYAYTNQVYGPEETSFWGTWWAQVSPPVPANDAFSAGFSISGAQGSTNGMTIRATRETSEPNHASSTNTPSVWYTWTAPTSGYITLQLTNAFVMGSQAALAVYTGSSVSALTLVTNHFGTTPTVTFNAVNGTTYRIAASGYNNSASDFTLTWNQPTAPLFVQHPQTTNVVAGENVTLTSLAIGSPTPSYQWRREGNNVAGATSSSYSITNVQTSHGTNYTVVASNSSGMATSSVGGLIVHGDSASRLSLWGHETNAFRLHISGVTNRGYIVQTSTNLNSETNWYSIHTNFVSFWYTNFPTSNDLQRYYRAITNN